MRIQAKHLITHLQRSLAPIYLIFGEEPLQRKEAIETLREKAKSMEFTERETIDFSEQNAFLHLNQTKTSFSLFASKRIIECYFTENKISNELKNDLAAFKTHPDLLFVFILPFKVNAAFQQASWFKHLESLGVGIPVPVLASKDFGSFLQARLKQQNLPLSEEAFEYLQKNTQGNLLAAANIIEILKLIYAGEEKVKEKALELKAIQEVVSADTRFTLYELVDAILQGLISRTLQIFQSLKNEEIDPILVLWVLTREVRTIIPLATLATQGRLKKESLEEHGVWQYRRGFVTSFINRCSLNALHQSLITAKSIDALIKKSLIEDAWRMLLSLTLQLTGVKDV